MILRAPNNSPERLRSALTLRHSTDNYARLKVVARWPEMFGTKVWAQTHGGVLGPSP